MKTETARKIKAAENFFAPGKRPIELGFFRRTFSVLNSRYGGANGEIGVSHFQKTMLRLFRIVGEERQFAAEMYDIDNSGTVGWWEFVRCWKDNEFYIKLSKAERIFLSIDDLRPPSVL